MPDLRELFWQYYERYLSAKHHKDEAGIQRYALVSLVQLHYDSSDQGDGIEEMREFMGPLFSEAQIQQMYSELRRDSGVAGL
jgi:hypothetical protein